MPLIQSLEVLVPATLANLGAGLDCIGIAIDLWNELVVERREGQRCWTVDIQGEGASSLPRNTDNVILQAVQYMLKKYAVFIPSLHFVCKNRIPLNRGLGSSAAAYVSGLIAGYALAHDTFTINKQEIYEVACLLECHPDNVGPAVFGGMQLTLQNTANFPSQNSKKHFDEEMHGVSGARAIEVKFQPNFDCVIFVPSLHLKTTLSREVLPPSVPLKDAVYNIGRAALLVNTFVNGNLDDLRVAMMDRLHQPYRTPYVPYLPAFIEAAYVASAKGACLSGSGPSVLAIVPKTNIHQTSTPATSPRTISHATGVSNAFRKVAQQEQIEGNVVISTPVLDGAKCLLTSP